MKASIEWTEDLDSRQATKRDLEDIARTMGLPVSHCTVRSLRIMIRHRLVELVAERDRLVQMVAEIEGEHG
jgi:hypothetical protein